MTSDNQFPLDESKSRLNRAGFAAPEPASTAESQLLDDDGADLDEVEEVDPELVGPDVDDRAESTLFEPVEEPAEQGQTVKEADDIAPLID
ncbi:hypothetical protein [Variovorax saccharolyticus]|uniref:hypothetical protein n=1 Tax=Variovorax saccharolyticus TaxID=3053516 RepID=UPI002577192E|nr:hypothetical protein [Variovorax sp. J31P216]MDM0029861.1 hypothetical protein [Variovorax sp. J31P216]